MFQGSAALSLDAKGRLAVPSRHREALAGPAQGRVVVTVHPHGCLLVYPAPAWEPIRDRIVAAPSFDPQSAMLKRLLVGMAVDEELDAAGRILVAPELREYASLEKAVRLVGMGSHFELWSEEGWRRQQDQAREMGEKLLPSGLADLAL